ncbi:putative helicase MOV-10 isoform X2 [Cloeon dipterum]
MDRHWERAHDFPNSRAFNWSDCLGFAGNDLEERNKIDRRRQANERLPGFDRTRVGSLNTVWKGTYNDFMIGQPMPDYQESYPNVKDRMRERQQQYIDWTRARLNPNVDVPILKMQRRSPELPKLEFHHQPWLELSAKSVAKKDQLAALDYLRSSHPQVNRELDEHNALQRCLAVPLLEYKWLQTALDAVSGECTLLRDDEDLWFAHLNIDLDAAVYQCLQEAVGVWAHFSLPGRGKNSYKDKLLVKALSSTSPSLQLKIGFNNATIDESWLIRMTRGVQLKCQIRFTSATIVYQIPYAATLDALTALRHLFFPGRGPPEAQLGSPLVPQEIIDGLRNGQQLIGGPLNDEQLEAVCNILTHSRLHHVYTLVGPPGTGKTRVLDEVLLQIYKHHMEDNPADALVHLVVNSNKGIGATVRRLLRRDVNRAAIVRLTSERELANCPEETMDLTQRASKVQYKREHQLVIGTPISIARISLSEGANNRPPLITLLDEAGSFSFPDIAGALTMNGQAVATVAAGDPLQLTPRSMSPINAALDGGKTIFHLLPHTGDWIGPNYIPHPGCGTYLTKNYRSHYKIVEAISSIFYGGKMTAAQPTTPSDDRCKLREALQPFGLGDTAEALYWLDFHSPAERGLYDPSLYNPGEARLVATIASQVSSRVGANRVCVLTPYRRQMEDIAKLVPQKIPVQTIDDILGLERDIVVISLVRAEKGGVCSRKAEAAVIKRELAHDEHLQPEAPSFLGFMSHPNRANVMLSRGKEVVLIVGSKEHYLRSNADHWRQIADRCVSLQVANFEC